MQRLLTEAQMRRVEQVACENGFTLPILIQSAGQAIFDVLRARHADYAGKTYLVLIGPGNNGLDAEVVADLLEVAGARVSRIRYPAIEQWWATGTGLDSFWAKVREADVLVEGVFGLGCRPLSEGAAQWIVDMNAALVGKEVIAIDLPMGMDADTGAPMPAMLQATCIVAMGYPKRGHYQYPGRAACGEIVLCPLGLDDPLFLDPDPHSAWLITPEDLPSRLPRVPMAGHKGSYGRVSVVGGDMAYPGAPQLAAKAAYRAGAGLVRLVAPQDLFSQLIQQDHGIVHQSITHYDAAERANLQKSFAADEVIVLGPGWGRTPVKRQFITQLIHDLALSTQPLVIDADGLFALDAGWLEFPKTQGNIILTPHPKELARLSGLSLELIQADRMGITSNLAKQWGVYLLLKGANPVIATPTGEIYTFDFDVPALSVAGTGDILAGLIGGLLAQGMALLDALLVAAYSHAASAMAWQHENGKRGMMADDLLVWIPRILQSWRQ